MRQFPSHKFARFFISDRSVLIRTVVILALLVLILFQSGVLKKQDKQLAVLESAQKTAKPLASKPAASVRETPKEDLVLQGVMLKFGVPYAVISGEVYKAGDELRNYTIEAVEDGFIILKSNETGESKKIYFSQRLPGDVLQ